MVNPSHIPKELEGLQPRIPLVAHEFLRCCRRPICRADIIEGLAWPPVPDDLNSAAKSRQMPSLFKYIWKSGRVTVARAAGKSSVFMRTKLCPRLRNSMTTKSQVMSHLFDIINIICCCYSHILLSFESSPFSRSFFFVCGMCTPDASIAGGWSSLPSQRTRSTVRSYAYSGLGCSLLVKYKAGETEQERRVLS